MKVITDHGGVARKSGCMDYLVIGNNSDNIESSSIYKTQKNKYTKILREEWIIDSIKSAYLADPKDYKYDNDTDTESDNNGDDDIGDNKVQFINNTEIMYK